LKKFFPPLRTLASVASACAGEHVTHPPVLACAWAHVHPHPRYSIYYYTIY